MESSHHVHVKLSRRECIAFVCSGVFALLVGGFLAFLATRGEEARPPEPLPVIGGALAEPERDATSTPPAALLPYDTLLAPPVGPDPDVVANLEYIRSPRVIDALTISDVIPASGKLIAADLTTKRIHLYEDGAPVGEYPIATFGRPGTSWETPSGLYTIHTKERTHFSSIGKVYMPYSMQFFGNYFIHGSTYYPDGTLTSASYSGGCIKLATEDAAQVFAFADIGTKVFVYDPGDTRDLPELAVAPTPPPAVTAPAYLVADLDTGDVFLEAGAGEERPIDSIAKLMTALVANETISYNRSLSVPESALGASVGGYVSELRVPVGELMPSLLLASSDEVARTLAAYIGTHTFVRWMNNAAHAFSMSSTTFADATGESRETVSTPDDLFRLAAYLGHKKSFPFALTSREAETVTAEDGSVYTVPNKNAPASTEPFSGGKAGFGQADTDGMLSLMKKEIGGAERTFAVIVLGSTDRVGDMERLAAWAETALLSGVPEQLGCVACASVPKRKIALP